ncbi:AAA family ATPase [Tropicimonas sp. IMCC34043]|uniref:AAA family ATPase n=1 Tax=Tropicimonas sp. IMCC34043 TaxID=2248760 RepID=UPI000E242FB6|nr:AAA family ATPase [Tropicimonas sp. IMCC34043]
MKLVSIRLQNVRRFTSPVEIAGIGAGLNVLTAPNETGKSTVFDALHAMFFKDRKSWDKEVKSLAPHAGGDPEISVEIERDGAQYRVVKSWTKGRRGETRVFRGGHLIHQADDAEVWLSDLITAPKDGGPAGMLWVRQGLLAFQDDKETESARRSLVTSVSGEIETVTVGRQMDEFRAKCRREIETYLTTRGPKKGGPLAEALEKVEALVAREGELQARARSLREDLDRRARLRHELEDLRDPIETAAMKERLAAAQAAQDMARRHAEELDQARRAVQDARTTLESHRASIDTLADQVAESRDAARLHAEAQAVWQDAQTFLAEREVSLETARKAHSDASARAAEATRVHRLALKAEQAAHAAAQRKGLEARLAAAEGHRRTIERLTAEAGRGVDANTLQAIERLALELSVARKTRERAAPAVTMRYAGGRSDGVLLQGAPLPDGARVPLPDGGALDLEGIGVLTVHPGASVDDGTVDTAESRLAGALDAQGVESVEQARQSAQDRASAEAALRQAQAAFSLAAPDGLEPLRQALAELPAPVEIAEDLPTAAEAETRETAARDAFSRTETALETMRLKAEQARQAEIRASTNFESAAARLERAVLALARTQTPEQTLAGLRAALPVRENALADAEAALDELDASAPDLASTGATLDRLNSARKATEERDRQIERDLAGLDSRIALQAGEAVDEELAETWERLGAARAALDAVEFEVAVLQRLEAALETARQAARDRYVQPVLAELAPLVRMIWPEAELRFDADTLLPSGLVRTGSEEPFDVLSGGTQEQIALLVRLAFARILARSGNPAPVILDDAIVYTDDERIEAMFDALTLQATDLQIIVLSCRQKAFRGLGGNSLAIRPVAE